MPPLLFRGASEIAGGEASWSHEQERGSGTETERVGATGASACTKTGQYSTPVEATTPHPDKGLPTASSRLGQQRGNQRCPKYADFNQKKHELSVNESRDLVDCLLGGRNDGVNELQGRPQR